jgi:hypothetical protein
MKPGSRRFQWTLSCLISLTCFAGCVIVPLPDRHTYLGPLLSRESLAFLDLPETTRDDVLSSLGEPWLEIKEPGTLIYISGMKPTFLVVPAVDSHQLAKIEGLEADEVVLLVGYDADAHVLGHRVQPRDERDLKSVGLAWRRSFAGR